jgi:sugar diacid utilization regulator
VFAYAVVAADNEPPTADQFLLRLLAQQTGIAMANARLHERERAATSDLRTANMTLAETLEALERSTAIHQRLTEIAAAGGDQQAIASAVHFLTSYPVVIEDRHGNLRAWAGPDPDDPYPKSSPRARSATLRRAMQLGKPIRDGDHLLVVANPQADLIGVIALVDPTGTAGEREQIALEHGATVLAIELGRLRAVAETELRLGRDLVDDLLGGADEERSLARAQGLGYDLERAHRVVVVSVDRDREPDDLFHPVRRAVRDLSVGSLLVPRGATVALLSDAADADTDWERLRMTVDAGLGGARCRIGVGGRCSRPADFPRSYREAELALKVQSAAGGAEQVTEFDDLGVFRILAESRELSGIDRFVDRWLGSLLEYDKLHSGALVDTLTQYLEVGGNYEATAQALSTHRNTVKYRLQRIRAISGLDLSDADTRFNLQLAARALQTLNALAT